MTEEDEEAEDGRRGKHAWRYLQVRRLTPEFDADLAFLSETMQATESQVVRLLVQREAQALRAREARKEAKAAKAAKAGKG